MSGILGSLWCLPCTWSGLGLVAVLIATRYYIDSWVPAKGPLPSDGPAEGFPSRKAMKSFYDTSGMRVRAAAKAGVIVAGIWLVGLITLFLVLNHV